MSCRKKARFSSEFMGLFEEAIFSPSVNAQFEADVDLICRKDYIKDDSIKEQEYMVSLQLLFKLYGMDGHNGVLTAEEKDEIRQLIKDRHPIIPSPSLTILVVLPGDKEFTEECVKFKVELLQSDTATATAEIGKTQIVNAVKLTLINDNSSHLHLLTPLYNATYFNGMTLLHLCVLYGAKNCFECELMRSPDSAVTEDNKGKTPLMTGFAYVMAQAPEYTIVRDASGLATLEFSTVISGTHFSWNRVYIAENLLYNIFGPTVYGTPNPTPLPFKPFIRAMQFFYAKSEQRTGYAVLRTDLGYGLVDNLLDCLWGVRNCYDLRRCWRNILDMGAVIYSMQTNTSFIRASSEAPHFSVQTLGSAAHVMPRLCTESQRLHRFINLIMCPVIHEAINADTLICRQGNNCCGSGDDEKSPICVLLSQAEACLTLCLTIDKLITPLIQWYENPRREELEGFSLLQDEIKALPPGCRDMIQKLPENMKKLSYKIKSLLRNFFLCFLTAIHAADPENEVPFCVMRYLHRSYVSVTSKHISKDTPLCLYFFSLVSSLVDGLTWVPKRRDAQNRVGNHDINKLLLKRCRRIDTGEPVDVVRPYTRKGTPGDPSSEPNIKVVYTGGYALLGEQCGHDDTDSEAELLKEDMSPGDSDTAPVRAGQWLNARKFNRREKQGHGDYTCNRLHINRSLPGNHSTVGYMEKQGYIPELKHFARLAVLRNLHPGLCPFHAVLDLMEDILPQELKEYLLFGYGGYSAGM